MINKTISKVYDEIIEVKSLLVRQNAEYIDIDEASRYLRLKKSYIYNLVYKNKIPFYKPSGKKLYFNKLELSQWITKSKTKTIKEYSEEIEGERSKEKNSKVKTAEYWIPSS